MRQPVHGRTLEGMVHRKNTDRMTRPFEHPAIDYHDLLALGVKPGNTTMLNAKVRPSPGFRKWQGVGRELEPTCLSQCMSNGCSLQSQRIDSCGGETLMQFVKIPTIQTSRTCSRTSAQPGICRFENPRGFRALCGMQPTSWHLALGPA
jgi:hypothetical protein